MKKGLMNDCVTDVLVYAHTTLQVIGFAFTKERQPVC
jgi:hypothetical protein